MISLRLPTNGTPSISSSARYVVIPERQNICGTATSGAMAPIRAIAAGRDIGTAAASAAALALSAARVAELHAALSAYGPARLLVVLPVGARGEFAGEAGDIVALGERCWVGFLSRLGVADDNRWDIAYEDWVSICRKAAEAAQAAPLRSPAPPPAA